MTNLRAKLIAFIALGGGERTEVTCVINRQRMDDTLDVDGESRPFVIQQHQCGRIRNILLQDVSVGLPKFMQKNGRRVIGV